MRNKIFVLLISVSLALCASIAENKKRNQNEKSYGVCTTAACKKLAGDIKSSMDTSVKPCDNFYQFVCGNFVKNSIIQNAQSTNNSVHTINQNMLNQLKRSLEEKISPTEPESFQKVKVYYDVCKDEGIKETKSAVELNDLLHEMGAWRLTSRKTWKESEFDWLKTTYKLREKGFSFGAFFEVNVGEDIVDNKKKQVYLTPPTFGIKQEYLMDNPDPKVNKKIQSAYIKFMTDVAVEAFGVNKFIATEEMMEVYNLERTLAKNFPTEEDSRDPTNSFAKATIGGLEKNLPFIPWLEYFNTVFAPHKVFQPTDIVTVIGFKYFKLLGDVLAKTPNRIVANYIGWRMIWQSMNSLSNKFRNAYSELATAQTGITAKNPRWLTCVQFATLRFPLAIGSMYVKDYFDSGKKEQIGNIIKHLHETFREIMVQVDWMDEKTKIQALDKLKAMTPLVAYPKELLMTDKIDEYYKDVVVNPKSLIKTELSINRFILNDSFKSLDKRVDKFDWTGIFGSAATINAFYTPQGNAILFPAGILQSPYFHVDHPKYVNYGTIGYVVGHEMTHGFDDTGRNFDKEGNLREWWDPNTKAKFVTKAKCIVDQYSSYTVKEVNMKVNGAITVGENIADNGGVKIAYRAYQKFKQEEPRLPGLETYTPNQMFWISNAFVQCTKYRPEMLKNLMITDSHAPSAARVIGSMSNRPEFSADFSCPSKSVMNPVNKCSVW